MAAMLATLVTAFSASNFAVTRQHMMSTPQKGGKSRQDDSTLLARVEKLITIAEAGNDQQAVAQLITMLDQIKNGVSAVQNVTGQLGQAMVHVSADTRVIKQRVGGQ